MIGFQFRATILDTFTSGRRMWLSKERELMREDLVFRMLHVWMHMLVWIKERLSLRGRDYGVDVD
jgi:hypothetical protein